MALIDLLNDNSFGILRSKKGVVGKVKIIGWDSEDDGQGHPIMFTFHDGAKGYTFKRPSEAIKFMVEYPDEACFCAHNLEYDVGNLFKESNFRQIDRMVYASRLLRVSLKFTQNFMVNSLSFFPGSLASMGDIVGLKKLDGDPLSTEYGQRDAHIVQVFMDRLQNKLVDNYHTPLGVSIGQVSMDIYRRAFMPFPNIVSYNGSAALESFYGGRVEMFYKGIVEGGVKVVDFNSCYPFVMKNFNYPDTSQLKHGSIDDLEYGIGKFTVHVPSMYVAPLPWRSPGGRLFFPTGTFTGWWSFHEVRMALERGCKIIKEHQAIGTNFSVKPFGDFVNHFYGSRQLAKIKLETEPFNEEALFQSFYDKAVMNNCFGKLIMHKPGNMLTRTPMPESFLEQNPFIKVNKHGPFYSYTVPRTKAPASANYMWGLYITSYARRHLYQHLSMVHDNGGRLIYCDTDSIMYSDEKNVVKGLKIGLTLGELSAESYDLGVFRQSKGYLLCNRKEDGHYKVEKVACKGVATAYSLEFIVKGMAHVMKPMRLKEALIRISADKGKKVGRLGREVGINVWDEVKKEMRSIYIKRKGHHGVTQSIDVSEIPELEENAFGEPEDMTDVLSSYRLEAKKKKTTNFDNVLIPANWFDHDDDDAPDFDIESTKIQMLSMRECESITVGETWVAGTVLSGKEGKYGFQYVLKVDTYLDFPLPSKKARGIIPCKYFQHDVPEKFLIGKRVELFLDSDYIKGQAVNFRIEVYD